MWSPYITDLVALAKEKPSGKEKNDHENIVVEVLGILGNLTSLDFGDKSWSSLITKMDLMQYFNTLLIAGLSRDDIVLQVIMILSGISSDAAAAPLIMSMNSKILSTLQELLRNKTDDIEITLQVLFCLLKMLQQPTLLDELLYGTGILPDVLQYAGHANMEIRQVCECIMHIVLDHDLSDGSMGEFGRQVRKCRFQLHNKEYVVALGDDLVESSLEGSFDCKE